MDKNFNSNFYIVTATIIPVFYLAMVVQAPLLNGIVSRLAKNLDRMWIYPSKENSEKKIHPKTRARSFILIGSFLVPVVTGLVALLASVIGEIDSVLALYYQTDSKYYKRAALTAIFALLAATLIGPLWTTLVAYIRFNVYAMPREDRDRFKDRWRKRWLSIVEPEAAPSQQNQDAEQGP